jgi:hypothetical protein
MQKRRAYRATDVKDVALGKLLLVAPAGAVTIGFDVGKYEIYAVVRWQDGSFERPWKAQNPEELDRLVGVLREIWRILCRIDCCRIFAKYAANPQGGSVPLD